MVVPIKTTLAVKLFFKHTILHFDSNCIGYVTITATYKIISHNVSNKSKCFRRIYMKIFKLFTPMHTADLLVLVLTSS